MRCFLALLAIPLYLIGFVLVGASVEAWVAVIRFAVFDD